MKNTANFITAKWQLAVLLCCYRTFYNDSLNDGFTIYLTFHKINDFHFSSTRRSSVCWLARLVFILWFTAFIWSANSVVSFVAAAASTTEAGRLHNMWIVKWTNHSHQVTDNYYTVASRVSCIEWITVSLHFGVLNQQQNLQIFQLFFTATYCHVYPMQKQHWNYYKMTCVCMSVCK